MLAWLANRASSKVLGTLLWNILYNPVLDVSLLQWATTLAYIDDIVFTMEALRQLQKRINEALTRINTWMLQNNLTLTPEKTGPHTREQLYLEIQENKIMPSNQISRGNS